MEILKLQEKILGIGPITFAYKNLQLEKNKKYKIKGYFHKGMLSLYLNNKLICKHNDFPPPVGQRKKVSSPSITALIIASCSGLNSVNFQ